MSTQLQRVAHLRLNIKGTLAEVLKFNRMAKMIDPDWPFLIEKDETVVKCKKCGGVEYNRPLISPSDIKILGRQAGCRKVRISHYALAGRCTA